MTDNKGPWEKTPKDQKNKSNRPYGFYIWVGLLLVITLGIIGFITLFPEQNLGEDSSLQIIHLIGLLALVSSGLIYTRRFKFWEISRNIGIWIGIAATLLIGFTYQTELKSIFSRVGGELMPGQATYMSDEELVITANVDGHYYISGRANGITIRFLIDTGASSVVLSPRDAARAGIDLSTLRFTQKFQTANGIGYGAPYRLDRLSIGFMEKRDFKVSINQAAMNESLLGMSFLKGFKSFEFRDRKLYLRR